MALDYQAKVSDASALAPAHATEAPDMYRPATIFMRPSSRHPTNSRKRGHRHLDLAPLNVRLKVAHARDSPHTMRANPAKEGGAP